MSIRCLLVDNYDSYTYNLFQARRRRGDIPGSRRTPASPLQQDRRAGAALVRQ